MKLHEEFKLFESMWDEPTTLKEGWYSADAQVEFETSVYPDIAKYFGLGDDCEVEYAVYFVDEVTVYYKDAAGESCEIARHVPIDQVEKWFEVGYTILDDEDDDLDEAAKLTEEAKGPCYVIKAKDSTGKVVFNSVTNGKTYPELEDVITALQTEKELDMKNHYEIIWVNSGSTLNEEARADELVESTWRNHISTDVRKNVGNKEVKYFTKNYTVKEGEVYTKFAEDKDLYITHLEENGYEVNASWDYYHEWWAVHFKK